MKRILLAGIATLILTSPAMAANTRIGVTMALFDDNFLTNVREAMAAQAKTMPGVEIKFEDAQADIGRQINQVQNFIAEGVSAIIVNPADTSATRSITKMVESAGIPLVYVNRARIRRSCLKTSRSSYPTVSWPAACRCRPLPTAWATRATLPS